MDNLHKIGVTWLGVSFNEDHFYQVILTAGDSLVGFTFVNINHLNLTIFGTDDHQIILRSRGNHGADQHIVLDLAFQEKGFDFTAISRDLPYIKGLVQSTGYYFAAIFIYNRTCHGGLVSWKVIQ